MVITAKLQFMFARFQKLTLVTIFVLLLSVVTIHMVMAQEEIQVEDINTEELQVIADPALKLSFSFTEQSYPDQRFGLILNIDSAIDSDRAGITWIYPSSHFLIVGPPSEVVKVRSGEVTTVTKYFLPIQSVIGKSKGDVRGKFGARVNAFVADVNYLSSNGIEQQFNKDLEKLPIADTYQRDKTVTQIFNILICAVVIVVVVSIIIFAVRKFRTYINTPDVET